MKSYTHRCADGCLLRACRYGVNPDVGGDCVPSRRSEELSVQLRRRAHATGISWPDRSKVPEEDGANCSVSRQCPFYTTRVSWVTLWLLIMWMECKENYWSTSGLCLTGQPHFLNVTSGFRWCNFCQNWILTNREFCKPDVSDMAVGLVFVTQTNPAHHFFNPTQPTDNLIFLTQPNPNHGSTQPMAMSGMCCWTWRKSASPLIL